VQKFAWHCSTKKICYSRAEIFWNSIHRACSFHQFLLLPN
jgi:hypothetical protein